MAAGIIPRELLCWGERAGGEEAAPAKTWSRREDGDAELSLWLGCPGTRTEASSPGWALASPATCLELAGRALTAGSTSLPNAFQQNLHPDVGFWFWRVPSLSFLVISNVAITHAVFSIPPKELI